MILDARPLVEEKIIELKERVGRLHRKPKLVIIKIGKDMASGKYVNNKINLCKQVGVESEIVEFSDSVSEEVVRGKINELNLDKRVTAILLQLPIPLNLNEKELINAIDPKKDIDGFTSINLGNLLLGMDSPKACTPTGIMSLLDYYNIDLNGKDVLIINRSNIVGKPLAFMMLERNATVTIAHSKTTNLKEKIKNADVVVLGVGIADFLGKPHFKPGTVIVDVSINMNKDGKLCGDVCKDDYDKLIKEGCHITPVPNGVGRTTVLSLVEQAVAMIEKEK